MALCTRVCLLEAGRVEADGKADEVVELYQKRVSAVLASPIVRDPATRPGRGTVRIASFRPERAFFRPADAKIFHIQIVTHNRGEAPFYLSVRVIRSDHQVVMCIDSHHCEEVLTAGGLIELSLIVKSPWFCPGEYRLDALLYNMDIIDNWEDACRFGVSTQLPYRGAIYEPAIKASAVLPEFSISRKVVAAT